MSVEDARSAEELKTAIVAKERASQEASARIDRLQERLAGSELRRAQLRDVLGEGEDGLPLAMQPLYAALVGAVAVNGAVFFTFVEWLTKFNETVWNVSLALAMALGLISVPLMSRPGAGGLARVGLRRVTIVGLALALAGVVAAAIRAST